MAGLPPNSSLSLYVRALDQLEPTLLSSEARSPFFSPDGQWVGFVESNSQLSKVALTGGPSLPISELDGSVRGAIWSSDDTIIFGTNNSSTGLQRVSAAGGDTEILTMPDTAKGEVDHLYPDLLPGERAVLFTIANAEQSNNSQIALLDLESGEYRVLINGGSYARYSESGHIVYGVAETLRAVPFDLDRLEVTGNPVPVLDGVVTHESGSAAFSLAPNGTLVYMTGGSTDPFGTLVWVDHEGREEPLMADRQLYRQQRLSPDGQRLALKVGSTSDNDIWVYDLLRGTTSRLTFDPADNDSPFWTPDGQRVVFSSDRDGGGLYSKAANGTGQVESLLTGQDSVFGYFFSPDGDRLVFGRRGEGWDIHVLSTEDGTTQALIEGPGDQEFPSISPDGRWIAYDSNESGRKEVYVRPFPEVGSGKWQISRSIGVEPRWGPQGKEIFFLSPDNTMMAVTIESASGFSAGIPRVLFSTDGYVVRYNKYSVSPDGQRFLMFKSVGASGDAADQMSLVVVENWFEELKRLAPTAE
jgi:serine/threonine-protein kinase